MNGIGRELSPIFEASDAALEAGISAGVLAVAEAQRDKKSHTEKIAVHKAISTLYTELEAYGDTDSVAESLRDQTLAMLEEASWRIATYSRGDTGDMPLLSREIPPALWGESLNLPQAPDRAIGVKNQGKMVLLLTRRLRGSDLQAALLLEEQFQHNRVYSCESLRENLLQRKNEAQVAQADKLQKPRVLLKETDFTRGLIPIRQKILANIVDPAERIADLVGLKSRQVVARHVNILKEEAGVATTADLVIKMAQEGAISLEELPSPNNNVLTVEQWKFITKNYNRSTEVVAKEKNRTTKTINNQWVAIAAALGIDSELSSAQSRMHAALIAFKNGHIKTYKKADKKIV
jgi:hypothetical protein